MTRCDVRATGLYLLGSPLLPPLCIGVMMAVFKESGTMPSWRERVHKIWSGFASSSLQFFSSNAWNPSGPAEALGAMSFMAAIISCSVISTFVR